MCTYFHIKALVVVRISHVSVIEHPNISHIEDFAIFLSKEFLEVFSWLNEITEPKHGWEIVSLSLQELTSKLN
jgi:hypothetical protein